MARSPEGDGVARRRWVGPTFGVLLVVGAFWLLSHGANRPVDPFLDPVNAAQTAGPSTTVVSAAQPATTLVNAFTAAGFGELAFAVTGAGGLRKLFCGLLADTEKTRRSDLFSRSSTRTVHIETAPPSE